jgi:hypothetical protein
VTQPDYVPLTPADRVRPAERLPPPGRWKPDRPADLHEPGVPTGPRFGRPGPDLGYGMKLARRFEDRIQLAEGESAEDAVAGCFAVGTARASLFGRAPVIFDFEHSYTLWGFLGSPPAELVTFRKPLFQGAAHHYAAQRVIVDRVPAATLRLTPAQVAERLGDWRSLLST